jgi:uncharacterized protein (TIGR03435 family)
MSDHYDVTAKVPDAAALQDDPSFVKTRPLLQSLLEDRFNLRVHRETRQLPIYALVRAKTGGALGPRLTRSSIDCAKEAAKCGFRGGPVGQIAGNAIPNDILMQLLGNATDRIVVDRTGLEGPFDVDLEWSPDQTATDKPSIFTAVQEQLGLKLESATGPVEVLVIDHVERPTED